MMPSLLRDSARNSSDARTRRGSTVRGIAIPCFAPIILIHMHRTLWMWAAIIRTVRRGTPGTALDHIARGRFSMRYIVTRLFVRQAAIRERPVSKSVRTFVHSGSGALTPNVVYVESAIAPYFHATRQSIVEDVTARSHDPRLGHRYRRGHRHVRMLGAGASRRSGRAYRCVATRIGSGRQSVGLVHPSPTFGNSVMRMFVQPYGMRVMGSTG